MKNKIHVAGISRTKNGMYFKLAGECSRSQNEIGIFQKILKENNIDAHIEAVPLTKSVFKLTANDKELSKAMKILEIVDILKSKNSNYTLHERFGYDNNKYILLKHNIIVDGDLLNHILNKMKGRIELDLMDNYELIENKDNLKKLGLRAFKTFVKKENVIKTLKKIIEFRFTRSIKLNSKNISLELSEGEIKIFSDNYDKLKKLFCK